MAGRSTFKEIKDQVKKLVGFAPTLPRQERAAQRRARELQREARELAKLSEGKRARLEVESYENRIEVILSIHKEQGPSWDWNKYATALPPAPPVKASRHELKAKQRAVFLRHSESALTLERLLSESLRMDGHDFARAAEAHQKEAERILELAEFARRILAGEAKAYTEALSDWSPLAELTDLGSSIHFTVHDRYTLECKVCVSGAEGIPPEIKSITASGKLSSKKMPKGRFHELYQDYVCGCILRVGREVFALLPVETVLVTAYVEGIESRSGNSVELPILSVALSRSGMKRLNFDQLDPSDAMINFLCRGDAKASKRTGEFTTIEPLTIAEIQTERPLELSPAQLLETARLLREHLRDRLKEVTKV